ncbi:MAG: HAD family phosphatase [Elusimicrobiaceae bacterium]|nr:HAD family phosphatase [Elusimicrobiaceae bacterium]
MIESVIFDMDGLLLSTEPIYFKCYQKAAAAHGQNFTFELFKTCVGMSTADSTKLIEHHFGGQLNAKDLYRLACENFESYVREGGEILFRPGAKEAVEFFHRRGFKLAVASSNIRRWVEGLLRRKEVWDYFRVVVTSEDVSRPKPDPEIYLTAARLLGTDTPQCLAFEDSVAGATAAISAHIRTCVVPQIKQPDTFVREHAFRVYKSLEDIYPDMDELLG